MKGDYDTKEQGGDEEKLAKTHQGEEHDEEEEDVIVNKEEEDDDNTSSSIHINAIPPERVMSPMPQTENYVGRSNNRPICSSPNEGQPSSSSTSC